MGDKMSKMFAQIDENNIVLNVQIAESIEFVLENFNGNWIETFEDNLAGIGYIYDSEEKVFINPNQAPTFSSYKEFLAWEQSQNQS